MAGTFVNAGGSSGIGWTLVKRLRGNVNRILVHSANLGHLDVNRLLQYQEYDFCTSRMNDASLIQAASESVFGFHESSEDLRQLTPSRQYSHVS
jgi:short-subunit dehydrogenase involved in D-alanine esterification of teichoic acids